MATKHASKTTVASRSTSGVMLRSNSALDSDEEDDEDDDDELGEEETRSFKSHSHSHSHRMTTRTASTRNQKSQNSPGTLPTSNDAESHTSLTYSYVDRSTHRDSNKTATAVSVDDEDEEDTIKENFINTFFEMGPNRVGAIDAIQISCILEDLSDQLEVVGVSMDVNQVDLRSRFSKEYDDVHYRPVFTVPAMEDPFSQSLFKEKYFLRQRYGTVTSRRIAQYTGHENGSGYRDRLSAALRGQGVNKFTMKGKIYSDKTHLNIILDNVITELVQKHTFDTLQDAVDRENENYREMKEKFERKVEAEKRIQETKEALKRTRREKRIAMKDSRKSMMGIEDSKQEILKRKELEYLYVHKTGEMMKTRIKKMCGKYEKEVKVQMEDQKAKGRLCDHAHHCMIDIIYKKYREAQRRLEYWMDKYELDKESLQSSLDTLKANRQRDLERMAWLRAYIYDYNQIVKDERRIKGIATERDRIAKLKDKKAIKIQAWWRGEMVRKRLGPYMPPEERAKRNRNRK